MFITEGLSGRTMKSQSDDKLLPSQSIVKHAKQRAELPDAFQPLTDHPEAAVVNEIRPSSHSVPGDRDNLRDTVSALQAPKRTRRGPFLLGMVSSATGIGIVLCIAFGLVQLRRFAGDLSTLLLSGLMIFSVLLIGSGFGMMVLSATVFDHQEFDRLVQAGNITAVDSSTLSAIDPPESAELKFPAAGHSLPSVLKPNVSAANSASKVL